MKKLTKKMLMFVFALALTITTFVAFGKATDVKADQKIKTIYGPKTNADIVDVIPGEESDAIEFVIDMKRDVYVGVESAAADNINVAIYNSANSLVKSFAVTTQMDGSTAYGVYGNVITLKAGTYKVKFSAANYNRACLYVLGYPSAISQKNATITQGFATKLSVVNGEVKTWTSNNKKVAVVDQKGKVTAKAPGKAKIVVTLKNGKKFACNVKVVANTFKDTKLTIGKVRAYDVGLWVHAMSYDKKGNLVLKCRFGNRCGYPVVNLKKVKLVVKNESGKVIGVFNGSKKITVKNGAVKDVTFTLAKSKMKLKKKQDLKNAYIDYKNCSVRYTYRY